MQVVILAAGEGTRMRPLTDHQPKPMLPVAGRPLVEHVAERAVEAGARELLIVVGYEGDQIREHFGEEFQDVPVRYAQQETQQGTADAVEAASEMLDGTFAVLNGDNLYDEKALDWLFENVPSVGCAHASDPENYGVLEVEDGHISDLTEKPDDPASTLVNAGVYVFPADARDDLEVPESERGERELTDVLQRVIEREAVTPIVLDTWQDIGRPWELLEANERYVGKRGRAVRGTVHETATINGPVVVESGATIGPGVLVQGPAIIRSGATVGKNAYIQGATVIGENVTVADRAEIENSVVLPETMIGQFSYVLNSIIGTDCTLGPRTTILSTRKDGHPVSYPVKGEMVSTGRQAFGAVLGDNVDTAPGVTIDPGTKVPTGSSIAERRYPEPVRGERISHDS